MWIAALFFLHLWFRSTHANKLCEDGQFNFRIEIFTDDYPGDTSWELQNDDYDTINSGGDYEQQDTLFTHNVCLNTSCYDFHIYDSYGDGLCCLEGDGFYRGVLDDASVLFEGGEFMSSEVKGFCVGDIPSSAPSISSMPSNLPSIQPSIIPSTLPSKEPSPQPSTIPSVIPTSTSTPTIDFGNSKIIICHGPSNWNTYYNLNSHNQLNVL